MYHETKSQPTIVPSNTFNKIDRSDVTKEQPHNYFKIDWSWHPSLSQISKLKNSFFSFAVPPSELYIEMSNNISF